MGAGHHEHRRGATGLQSSAVRSATRFPPRWSVVQNTLGPILGPLEASIVLHRGGRRCVKASVIGSLLLQEGRAGVVFRWSPARARKRSAQSIVIFGGGITAWRMMMQNSRRRLAAACR